MNKIDFLRYYTRPKASGEWHTLWDSSFSGSTAGTTSKFLTFTTPIPDNVNEIQLRITDRYFSSNPITDYTDEIFTFDGYFITPSGSATVIAFNSKRYEAYIGNVTKTTYRIRFAKKNDGLGTSYTYGWNGKIEAFY